MMKNACYFTLKALFILKIFKLLFDFFIMQRNKLVRKFRLILTYMRSQPGKKTITVHYCPLSQEFKAMRQRNLVS